MATRLGNFMTANRITSLRLSARADVSTATVASLRSGRNDPRLRTMIRVARAISRILRRRVPVRELFDLGDDE
jgi:predicted transcriptional regulator